MSRLACELVVPQEQLTKIGENTLTKKFARTQIQEIFKHFVDQV